LLGLLALLAGVTDALAGTLVINANTADATPRAAWEAVVQRFQRENPDVRVEFNIYDHESYKKSVRNWLTSAAPDVVFWFAGNRMRQLVAPGLLDDVTDLYTPQVRAALHPSTINLVSYERRQYVVPYTYYQVGFYYRRDLLADAGFTEFPRTWEDLLSACERLVAKGIEPFALGSRDLWPAAAWFDYIDLRLNGFTFHMDMMEGRVPYDDPRVRDVFARWRELIDRRCFSRNHAASSWQESQALLYDGRAASMLIGNYIVGSFPASVKERMEFAPFPTMRADVQQQLNARMLQIPVHRDAAVADDRFLRKGRDLLAKSDALAQYFDRDTSEDLANVAMKGFQEFMLNPDRVDAVLANIERARLRIHPPGAREGVR
jgi:multiple sugar transport system substrate-binding protein